MNQALKMSEAEHGQIGIVELNENDDANSNIIAKWYQENITKYIKTIVEEEINEYYYSAALIDGSGFLGYGNNNTISYIFYCIEYKKCEPGVFDGKDTFLFIYDSEKQRIKPVFSGNSIYSLKASCYKASYKNQRHGCAALIEANGWKIPDDYIIKF